MQVELTVRHAGRSAELAVRAAGPVTVAEVREDIERAAGSSGGSWWSGGALLGPDAVVGADLRSGAVVDLDGPGTERATGGILTLQQVGGPGAGRVVPLGRGQLIIGRDPDCDLSVADPDASRRHVRLEITGSGVTVHDLHSTNGTTIDGTPLPRSGRPARTGERIRVGDSTFCVATPNVTPATVRTGGDGDIQVLRPPRRADEPPTETIDVPIRSDSMRPRGVQWAAALAPACVGAAIAWFAHSPQFLLFALLSPVMMVSTSMGDRLHWRRSRRRDAASHGARRDAAEAKIAAALRAETAQRHDAAPDPAAIGLIAALPATRLWERRRSDADFLHRTAGYGAPSLSTCRREGTRVGPAADLPDVPVCINLQDGPLGVAAPAGVLDGVARSLVGQVVTLHPAADVEVVLLLAGATDWRWCRWLPHWRGDVPTSARELARTVAELAEDVDLRLRSSRPPADGWSGRWRVLVIDRAAALADVPGLAALLARGRVAGITAVCLDEDPAALPSSCATIVRATGVTGSRAVLEAAGTRRCADMILDSVPRGWADQLARSLAPLVDAGADASTLPESCTLLPVLGLAPDNPDADAHAAARIGAEISDRWAASDGSAATSIGIGADGPMRFDLTADGPHALIAGTTGAGKSELLRSLVAGSPSTIHLIWSTSC